MTDHLPPSVTPPPFTPETDTRLVGEPPAEAAGQSLGYLLAAVDRKYDDAGHIVQAGSDEAIYVDVLKRTFGMSAVVTAFCLLLGFEGRYRVLDNGRSQLETIKQSLALTMLPAIPLDAFLTMLRDELKFDLPLRTAQDMISDGRLPIVPKLRAGDKPWINLHRWREMTKEPEHYFKFVHENSRRRVAKDSTSKSRQRAAA